MPRKHHVFFLICALALILFSGIYGHDLISRGEGREALVAQAILSENEWILPEGYAGDVPSKPPLLHWISAIISLPLGEVTDVTVRLPSAILSFFLVIIFYQFLAKRNSERLAFYSVAILFTSLEFSRAATVCRVDMVFCAFIFLGMLAFYKWKEREFRGFPISTIVFLCFAVLCKGPAGLILPCAVFSLWLYSEKTAIQKLIPPVATVVISAFLLSLVWYLAAYFRAGEPFLNKVYDENIARFLGNMDDEAHQHSALYLWLMFFLGLSPWSFILFIPFSLFVLKNRVKLSLRELESFDRLSIISVVVFIVFFSLPSSKRGVYLLPIYPFVSYFFAKLLLHSEITYPRALSRAFMISKTIIFIVTALVFSLYIGHESLSHLSFFEKEKNQFILEIPKAFYLNKGLLWIIPGFFAYFLIRTALKSTALNFLCVVVLFFSSMQVMIVIPYSNLFSPMPFAVAFNDKFKGTEKLYSHLNEFYSLSFYLKKKIYRFKPDMPLENSLFVIFEDKIDETEKVLARPLEILLESQNNVEKPQKKLIAAK